MILIEKLSCEKKKRIIKMYDFFFVFLVIEVIRKFQTFRFEFSQDFRDFCLIRHFIGFNEKAYFSRILTGFYGHFLRI